MTDQELAPVRGRCNVIVEQQPAPPVEAVGGFGTKLDVYNRVTFQPVETTGLRVEVQLQPNYSGGILEWKFVE